MAANDGEHPVRDLFGVALPTGTGAPGTQGISAADTTGEVIGNPGIASGDTYQSGQLPRDHVVVTAGDTSGMSDDNPAHEDAIMPGPASAYVSTGAGDGDNGDHYPRYPWQEPAS